MALNRDKVGASYPPYRYEVSREKILEYARAVGEDDPRYLAEEGDLVAPPTFAACFTITKGGEVAFADEDLGTHETLVHGGQRFTFGDRPLRPGDVLTCTTTVADVSARGGNEFLVLEVACHHEDGSLAVLAEETIVFLGSAPGREDAS